MPSVLSGICTPWLGRSTWLPPVNSLTPPIREHCFPTPCYSPYSPGEAAPAKRVFGCPNPGQRVARRGHGRSWQQIQEADTSLPYCILPGFGGLWVSEAGGLCSQLKLPWCPSRSLWFQGFSSRPRHCSCTWFQSSIEPQHPETARSGVFFPCRGFWTYAWCKTVVSSKLSLWKEEEVSVGMPRWSEKTFSVVLIQVAALHFILGGIFMAKL